jgi:outer membrane protein OmpA-like peptidoglycan-associated protein
MKKNIILLILIFGLGQLNAQTDIFNWKVTTEAGSFSFEKSFSFPQDLKSAAAGLHFERTLSRSFSAGLSLFAGQPHGGELKNAGYAALTLGFRWDNGWLLGERVFMAPFHTLEAGYLTGEKRIGGSSIHDIAAGMTHGLKFRFSDRISARLGIGMYYPINDTQSEKLSELVFYQQWKVGISYHFGTRKISYQGPVFNAGDFFPVQGETPEASRLAPFYETEALPHPIIRRKAVEEEKTIVGERPDLPEESRINIFITDSLIQINVKEGEAVIINISPQIFRGSPIIEKETVIEKKIIDEQETEEKPEEATPEIEPGEKTETKTQEAQAEKIEEIVEEVVIEEIEEKVLEAEEKSVSEVVEEIEIEEMVLEAEEAPIAGPTKEETPETKEPKEVLEALAPAVIPTAEAIVVPDSLAARYPVILTFPFNSASIQKSQQEVLEDLARDLEDHPLLLCKISGYADKSGDPIYNMILSGRRAEVIMQWLTGRGIDPGRISIEALGDKFSSAEFSEEERKVEIKIVAPPESIDEP